MKKIMSFLVAVAVFGMGSVAMADIPSYNGVDATSGVMGGFYAFTSIDNQCVDGEDGGLGGGIYGGFFMVADSDADYVHNANQDVGSGAGLYGQANLDLDGVDVNGSCVDCAPCDGYTGITGGALTADIGGGAFSGYGEGVAWAATNTVSVVTGSGNTSGDAGVSGYSSASNGFVGAWAGSEGL